jgi:toxin FitB
MTAYLLDTNVLSELIRPKPAKSVEHFLANERNLWLSVASLHEFTYGAELLADTAKRARLLNWTNTIEERFKYKLIAIDTTVAHQAGRLRATAQSQGRTSGVIDALIGACAISRGLTLATRNTKDFVLFGIPLFDPWQQSH